MITVATELSELANLFGFRYRIYAEEMSTGERKVFQSASKQIRDPLDHFVMNLIARDAGGAFIGAVQTDSGDAMANQVQGNR